MGAFKGGLHDGGILSSCGSSDMAGLLASVAPETGVGTRPKISFICREKARPCTLVSRSGETSPGAS